MVLGGQLKHLSDDGAQGFGGNTVFARHPLDQAGLLGGKVFGVSRGHSVDDRRVAQEVKRHVGVQLQPVEQVRLGGLSPLRLNAEGQKREKKQHADHGQTIVGAHHEAAGQVATDDLQVAVQRFQPIHADLLLPFVESRHFRCGLIYRPQRQVLRR